MRETGELVLHALKRLRTIEGFDRIRFIILFGSVAEERARETSDLDLCLYYDGSPEDAGLFRLRALSLICDDRYDLQMFLDLPLYVRMAVLKGRVIYCPEEQFLYDIALDTIREFDNYKHRLYDYLGTEVMV